MAEHTPEQIEQWARDAGIEQIMRKRDGGAVVLPTPMLARFAAIVAAAEREQQAPPGLVVSAYRVGSGIDPIRVERVGQVSGPDKWAVRHRNNCLSRSGEWEWEPMPSGRDDDFIARCRFDTADEACSAAIRARGAQGEAK